METKAATTLGYSTTIAYLAVPRGILETVLEDGYMCRSRERVPVAASARSAVVAMRKYAPPERLSDMKDALDDSIALEVHGLDEDKIVRNDDGTPKAIALEVLAPAHIREGLVFERGANEYMGEPCPLCRNPIPDVVRERGKVGLLRFTGDAFMVVPCKQEPCIRTQQERQRRLDSGEKKILYHQTSKEIAKTIRASGKMIRGGTGIAGAGIYFAESPRETEWKCEHKGEGVVLECEVRVGSYREVNRDAEQFYWTFASVHGMEGGPFDTVLLRRGICQEEGPGFGKKAGDEWVAYSWDQVRVLREVPRDPLPPTA